MSATLGPPNASVTPPAPDSNQDVAASARTLLRRREDPRKRLLRAALLVLGVLILVRGWMVTDIDLGKLTNASNAGPILKALLQPDVAGRDVTTTELNLGFTVGATSDQPSEVKNTSGQTLRITPGAVEPGETVAFDGSGFEPDGTGQLRLVFADGHDLLFTRLQTDARGAFHEERQWPDTASVVAGAYTFRLVLNAPVGALHPSETFVSSLGRMGETILLALMGTVFGVIISVPLSFLGARNLMGRSPVGQAVYWVVRLIFTITRSVEVLILGLVMVVIVGIGSYAGVLAIVVHSIGSLGKLYSEAIEGIEAGPVEAIAATGADRFQTVLYGVIPQVVPAFLSVTIYWWDHNVRMSTVLGLVGGGGIGYLLIQYINLLQFNQAATVLWMIVIVVTAMDYASAVIRARLV
ncbi:MAG TPA: phosphonate ABC transporter, permease protein PhnE [Chloroflexota bacterium]|nr:phosphonate ABC transporter, permease protein PhnE [Chloroflexota bacterium]